MVDSDPSIVVAYEIPMFGDGLNRLLAAAGYRITGTASGVRDAVTKARLLQSELLLLELADMAPPETYVALRDVLPETAVVVLWSRANEEALVAAVEAGARGCLPKDSSFEALLETLATVRAGSRSIDERAAGLVLDRFASRRGSAGSALTAKERAVLQNVAHGLTNAEIAIALHLSRHTVKEYLSSAMRKLGARGRAQAVHEAGRRGLIIQGAWDGTPSSEPDGTATAVRLPA
jgi:two-component system nitrate/nitrite response regulator NarL